MERKKQKNVFKIEEKHFNVDKYLSSFSDYKLLTNEDMNDIVRLYSEPITDEQEAYDKFKRVCMSLTSYNDQEADKCQFQEACLYMNGKCYDFFTKAPSFPLLDKARYIADAFVKHAEKSDIALDSKDELEFEYSNNWIEAFIQRNPYEFGFYRNSFEYADNESYKDEIKLKEAAWNEVEKMIAGRVK